MSIITLITDWGEDGAYVGAFKGKLLNQHPTASVIDISHKIKSFDKLEGAFILKNCYKLYPQNSIHVLGIGGNSSKKRESVEYIAFKKNGHYFIGANDGIWGLIFDEPVTEASVINSSSSGIQHGFPEIEYFAKAINYIMENQSIELLGQLTQKITLRQPKLPISRNNEIIGEVIFNDNYGNAITNISKEYFEQIRKDRFFKIEVKSFRNKITQISTAYSDVENGELLAIYSFTGFLEIAIANGSAKDLLSIVKNTNIQIFFSDSQIEQQPASNQNNSYKTTLF